VSSDEEIEQAIHDSINTHGEHQAKLSAYVENKKQNQAVDEWLESVAGVVDGDIKNEQEGTPSEDGDKKVKDVVIVLSDDED
jgi:hypothetical protein